MTKPLNIEVRGIGFPNKGAELMLLSICAEVGKRYPRAKICLSPKLPYHFRRHYPVYQIARVVKFGVDFGFLFYFLPRKLRDMFGIVVPKELNVLLDASGFAYGDQWGGGKRKDSLTSEIVRFKKNKNRKVILLPQAMGPFSEKRLISQMSEIIAHADLIYARDERSRIHICGVTAAEHIRQAPDFTNLFEVNSKAGLSEAPLSVCFIPNSKMLEMKTCADSHRYEGFMAGLICAANVAGVKPYLLIHEGDNDALLAHKIRDRSGIDLPIVRPINAADVKEIIATATLVVSSRFHGLVSALSQGIPVMATGWSHKYQALLDDYGVGQYMFDEQEDLGPATEAMLNLLENKGEYKDIVDRITRFSAIEKHKSREMWSEVFNLMDEVGG